MVIGQRRVPAFLYCLLLAGLLLLAVIGSASVGAAQLPLASVWRVVVDFFSGSLDVAVQGSAAAARLIIIEVRLPRILTALLVGAGLGVAGVVFQGLLLNPLADPFTIGVSAGAAFGATVAIMLPTLWPLVSILSAPAMVPWFAFGGAVFSLALVYFIARSRGRVMPESMILAGVIVASFLSALISFMKSIAGEKLATVVFWIMGGFSGALWTQVLLLLPYCLVCLIIIQAHAGALNIMAMGDITALQLGVEVYQVRRRLLLVAALLTAAAVSVSGVIGFVGLVVPHINRILLGPDHRRLLPASALLGGLVLVAADTLARTVAGATEIPVGVVTALLGAPFFCFIFKKKFHDDK
ncbi:MAG: iron ABC transporter permease [Deltaproteobacteria bacterium]|nr:iron ABC transporter permease [Deltaproteobacteria bacterium]